MAVTTLWEFAPKLRLHTTPLLSATLSTRAFYTFDFEKKSQKKDLLFRIELRHLKFIFSHAVFWKSATNYCFEQFFFDLDKFKTTNRPRGKRHPSGWNCAQVYLVRLFKFFKFFE